MSEAERAALVAIVTGLVVKIADWLVARAQAKPKIDTDLRTELRADARYWHDEYVRSEKEKDVLQEEVFGLRGEVKALKSENAMMREELEGYKNRYQKGA